MVERTPEMASEILDDTVVEPTGPQRRRIESPLLVPLHCILPQSLETSSRQSMWMRRTGSEMIGDFDDENDMLLEDMLKDDGKPPDSDPEEMEILEQQAGQAEAQRLFDINVIVQPAPEDLENGSFLTTKPRGLRVAVAWFKVDKAVQACSSRISWRRQE